MLITIMYRFLLSCSYSKKDIQRVRAKIHIPEFVSAALHVESWKQIRKGYGEREKVLKRYFNEQVAMNLFVVVGFF